MNEGENIRQRRYGRDDRERWEGRRIRTLDAGVELEKGLERMPAGSAGLLVGESEGEEGRVVRERHCRC
jgi:hypothetical protein